MKSGSAIAGMLLAAAALSGTAGAAEPNALVLARRLHRPGRAHPFADRSGRIPFTARVPDGVDAASLGLSLVAPGIGAVRLTPDEIDAFEAEHPGARLHAGPPRRPLLDVSKTWVKSEEFRDKTSRDGKGVVVGIVDTGLDARHPDFRNKDGTTRIAWMLAAGTPRSVHGDVEKDFCSSKATTACAVYDAADLNALIPSGNVPRDPEGHGTHVSSIAAGNGGITHRYIGMAPGATLVVAAPEPSGDGFFDADILNGVKFVFDRADALGMPCVVNLSLGGDYGGHDGSSDLEKGLAALVGPKHPGRAIVVAAGNSGGLFDFGDGNLYGIHTEAHVSENTRVRVPFSSDKAKKGQGFLWITFQPDDEISVGLEGPDGATWIGQVGPRDDAGYKGGDETTASVINGEPDDNSEIPAGNNSAVIVMQGAWPKSEFAVILEGHGQAGLWVTSGGDLAPGASLGLQFLRGIKQGTVGVPATSPDLLAVGCTINRDQWTPLGSPPLVIDKFDASGPPSLDGSCFFSGAGPTPTGVLKPEISAPGGFVAAAMAADADPRSHPGGLFDQGGCPDQSKCFVVDDTHAITIGTSMSAPHATGVIALLLEGDPTLTQAALTSALEAGARRATGTVPYDFQLGPGVVDAVGALRSLVAPASDAVNVAKSWYVLSSSYARADGTFPLVGTVELRDADGVPVGGVDASSLEVVVEGGVTLQPVSKIANGLYSFSLSGDPGGAGEPLSVDVRYRGRSLGVRKLDVGTDPFNTSGELDAVSGACACDVPGRASRAPTGALAAAAIALAAMLRSRRARP